MRTAKIMTLATIIFAMASMSYAEETLGVEGGLIWLTKHQEADGHWDSLKYGAGKKSDVAATSLALLAILGSGHSEKMGSYKGNVKRAVAWLISKQNDYGRIIDSSDAIVPAEEAWGSALASLTLSEAAAMANITSTCEAAQKAVNQLVEDFPFKNSSTADGTITYGIDEKADTATIGWVVMALKSAKLASLRVPHEAFDPVIKYLDSVEHKLATHSKDELAESEYRYSKQDRISDLHPSYLINAIGCLCRQYLGWKSVDLSASVQHFINQSGPPVWNQETENTDLYYWYYATNCTFQQRGEIWQLWNKPKNKALLENQCKEGDDRGSWNGRGSVLRKWGRVGQTALACLCMQIHRVPIILAP